MAWGNADKIVRPKWLLDRILLVGESVAASDDNALPELLIDTLREHFGAEHACIHVAEQGRLRPQTRAALLGACPAGRGGGAAMVGSAEDASLAEYSGHVGDTGHRDAEARFWRYALETRTVVTVSTTPAAIQDELRPLLAAAGARDGMAIPLLYRGDAYAVANLYFPRIVPTKLATAQNVIRSVGLLGNLVYGALQQEYYAGALRGSEGAALALAQAAAARDGYAAGHVARVCALAEALSDAAGVTSPAVREAVRTGAMLRDVGKLSVPDYILQKPGPLDAGERAQVRQHPPIGERMILEAAAAANGQAASGAGLEAGTGESRDSKSASDDSLLLAAAAVRGHHERLDGSGYPDGLAGDAIPLSARIVAIVDVYAALTSDRPYRAALPPPRAVEILREMAGPGLDPELVSLFLARGVPGAISSKPSEHQSPGTASRAAAR